LTLRFLGLETVLRFHAMSLELYGGAGGIRDRGLLESAIAQPLATFGGEYLHTDVFEMAAAYLFHVVENHPFVDGNKRTGLFCALAFLEANDVPTDTTHDLYELVISVAEGKLSKQEIAKAFRSAFVP
jgi:death-on-curing protein